MVKLISPKIILIMTFISLCIRCLTARRILDVTKHTHHKNKVSCIDQFEEADLVDLKSLKSYNEDFSYLMVVIDIMSKYAWVEPLTAKTNVQIIAAFKCILDRSKRQTYCLQADKGTKYTGASFQKFLKDHDIAFRITRNPDIKAAFVERFNLTLEERMWLYFTSIHTQCYIDVL